MADKNCDIAVIGGGPGGYVSAIRAAQLGAKVILVEEDELGGTCLNRGCMPTKALLKGVEFLDLAKKGKNYGIDFGEVKVDFSRLNSRKNTIVKTLVGGVTNILKSYSVEVLKGMGKLISPGQIEVILPSGRMNVEAKKIILATGSVCSTLPIRGIESNGVINSDDALELTEIPKSLVIIGGGIIGVEFANIFSKLGTAVTIIELMPQIIPTEDNDVAATLENSLKRGGVKTFTNASVSRIEESQEGCDVFFLSKEGNEQKISSQMVLVAVGRKPYTSSLDLEKAGVKTEKGKILANSRMETNIDNIYAIGDVLGKIMLAHVAMEEGTVAAENALGKTVEMDYRSVPRCIYTSPEIAAVGITEKDAKDKGMKVKTGKFPFSASGKAAIVGEREGFVKIISDEKNEAILGVQIIGPGATDLIAEGVLAIAKDVTVRELASTIHAHPTLSEPVKEAALDNLGFPIHIPKKTR